jgi:hypothetical protein
MHMAVGKMRSREGVLMLERFVYACAFVRAYGTAEIGAIPV